MKQHYEAFSKNDANYVPLSPLSFVTRTADLFPDRTAIIYGDRRYSWAESYARMRQLASALDGAGLGLGDTVSVIAQTRRKCSRRIMVCRWPGVC